MQSEAKSLVSVIIPAFNGAEFIKDAIESILHQTYQPIEILVIDDGSTDNTQAVLEPYLAQAAIRYLRQANAGHGAARNAGVRSAQGEHLCFLDQDDWLEPDSVERRVALYARFPALGMVFSDFRVAFPGAAAGEFVYEPSFLQEYHSIENIPADCIEVKTEGFSIFNPSVCIEFVLSCLSWVGTVLTKKSVIAAVGFFDEHLRCAPDHDLFIKIARAYPVGYLNACTAAYRQHSRNMSLDESRLIDDAIAIRLKYLDPRYGLRGQERKRLRRYLGDDYFRRAQPFIGSKRHLQATKYLRAAIRHDPWHSRYYLHMLLSTFPPAMVAILRNLRRKKGAVALPPSPSGRE